MAILSYKTAQWSGTALTLPAASVGGDKVPADSRGVVVFRNGDTVAHTITVAVPGVKYGKPLTDYTVTCAAGSTTVIGPFPDDLADPADGLVALTYDAVTGCTIDAFRF